MLTENQEIIYRKNGDEISRITKDNFKEFPSSVLQYVRHYQPFTKETNSLSIPVIQRGSIISTSEVQNVERKGNTLFVSTLNSLYEIEYKGIDLERVLADDKLGGINEPIDRIIPPNFPGVSS
jgi:hypothetical protein